MTYNFDSETEYGFDFDEKEVYENAVNAVLDFVDCPYETEVSLLLTDNEGIREINREQREIDCATDVLSFPMIDYELPGNFDFLDDKYDAFNLESGELLLGDIVISVDKIIEQAEAFSHTQKREYAFLIVHSMLHLTGFDHIEESDRIVMESHQQEIMKILNISR